MRWFGRRFRRVNPLTTQIEAQTALIAADCDRMSAAFRAAHPDLFVECKTEGCTREAFWNGYDQHHCPTHTKRWNPANIRNTPEYEARMASTPTTEDKP